jgi:hypothetical protein
MCSFFAFYVFILKLGLKIEILQFEVQNLKFVFYVFWGGFFFNI